MRKVFLPPPSKVCLKSIRNAAEQSYDEGLMKESSLLQELMTGSQSSALRYAFFAERAAQKVRGAYFIRLTPLTPSCLHRDTDGPWRWG